MITPLPFFSAIFSLTQAIFSTIPRPAHYSWMKIGGFVSNGLVVHILSIILSMERSILKPSFCK
jgi:hypothetical protein